MVQLYRVRVVEGGFMSFLPFCPEGGAQGASSPSHYSFVADTMSSSTPPHAPAPAPAPAPADPSPLTLRCSRFLLSPTLSLKTHPYPLRVQYLLALPVPAGNVKESVAFASEQLVGMGLPGIDVDVDEIAGALAAGEGQVDEEEEDAIDYVIAKGMAAGAVMGGGVVALWNWMNQDDEDEGDGDEGVNEGVPEVVLDAEETTEGSREDHIIDTNDTDDANDANDTCESDDDEDEDEHEDESGEHGDTAIIDVTPSQSGKTTPVNVPANHASNVTVTNNAMDSLRAMLSPKKAEEGEETAAEKTADLKVAPIAFPLTPDPGLRSLLSPLPSPVLNLLHFYLTKITAAPTIAAYKRINTGNATFVNTFGGVEEGVVRGAFEALGFEKSGEGVWVFNRGKEFAESVETELRGLLG